MSDPTHALLIRWTTNANKALLNPLVHIENEDAVAAHLVLQRVEKSILLLSMQPGMGTMTAQPGVRRYAIPQTGHTINYRIVHDELRILRWYRQGNSKNYKCESELKTEEIIDISAFFGK